MRVKYMCQQIVHKSEKTSPTHKKLTDLAVSAWNPCETTVGAFPLLGKLGTLMFENGKNDQKNHFLTKTPFWSLVLQGFQAAGLHATSCRLRH